MYNKSPFKIAVVNFKGGVGKTTIVWLIGQYLAEGDKRKVLLIDADAQMSLTLAVEIKEDGWIDRKFESWLNEYIEGKNRDNIYTALEKFEEYVRKVKECIKSNESDCSDIYWNVKANTMIYEIIDNLHLIPSVPDLYFAAWFIQGSDIEEFMEYILQKSVFKKYDYILFDLPPNFTHLSASILRVVDCILVPVNPDVFAARGLKILIDRLDMIITKSRGWPKVRVFMNKAGVRANKLHKKTMLYINSIKSVIEKLRSTKNIDVEYWESYIPLRADIRDSISKRSFPYSLKNYFKALCDNIKQCENRIKRTDRK
ncbi:MAG: ParA family protein [Crenarchaeota archaeon]|nr:ParA family protein [Thermoproteota archaeon]